MSNILSQTGREKGAIRCLVGSVTPTFVVGAVPQLQDVSKLKPNQYPQNTEDDINESTDVASNGSHLLYSSQCFITQVS